MNELPHRRKWLLDLAREAGDRYFDPATRKCLITRDTVWYALALLFDDRIERKELGRALLGELVCDDGTHTPATLLAMYHHVPDRLTPELRMSFVRIVESLLVKASDEYWKDGNVNHPLAAWCTLICGGALTGQRWAEEIGLRRLAAFRHVIGDRRSLARRQAEMSEYNSLTYTALDLWFLALIAEHAEIEEARELGLFLEQRLWVDVAMHYHAPSTQFAGPHSRSYQDDSWGGFSALHCTMLAGFDMDLPLFPELAYRYEHPSALVENALVAIIPFHVPDEARDIALNKPFPYSFRKTTYGECYHENGRDAEGKPVFDDDLYAGGWTDLTTSMTSEFALGTAALPYANAGHADSLVVRIRRNETIASLTDIRSMYTRGVYNSALPGQRNRSHVSGSDIDASYLYEEGRCATYQHGNRVIVNYAPKRSGHRDVASFRTDLLITNAAPFDQMIVNGDAVDRLPIDLPMQSRIVFRDHNTFGAIVVLGVEPAASETPIRLWECNGYLVLSLINREGEPRDFNREEIARWRAGFVIDLVTISEVESFDAYQALVESMSVSEEIGPDAVRTTTVTDKNGTMEFGYDPLRENILFRRWNGNDETVGHFSVECADTTGRFTPATLFGRELLASETP
ncbi:MAG: hypothetical protein R2832_13375 [Rhodothermales bacterium]